MITIVIYAWQGGKKYGMALSQAPCALLGTARVASGIGAYMYTLAH
jgi:hypothetical protein